MNDTANIQMADMQICHQLESHPEVVADTTLPTFRDKLKQIADNLYIEPMNLHDHRINIVKKLEASAALRKFDICVVEYLHDCMCVASPGCDYVIEVPVGRDIRVVADQFKDMLDGLGFSEIEEVLTQWTDYRSITLKLTW